MKRKNYITYKGITYKSYAELGRELDIPPETLRSRINRGWAEQDWGTKKQIRKRNYQRQVINYKGKNYSSIDELARFLKLLPATLRSRIKRGWPEEKWVNKKKESKVIYNNQEFESVKDLLNSLNIKEEKRHSFYGYIRNGLTPEESLEKIFSYKWDNGIFYENTKYERLKDLAEYLGINNTTLSRRIIAGKSQEEWGEVGSKNKAKVSMKYTFKDLSEESKQLINNWALMLNINHIEAYQLLVEKMI